MTEENESAFPVVQPDGEPCSTLYGLTKREYFAAMAMQGLCAYEGNFAKPVYQLAVEIADLTIQQLNK